MRIIDLVQMCRYEDVEKELKAHYDDFTKEKRKFRKLWSKLSTMTIKNVIDEEWYLYVFAGRDEFDEEDEEIYYDAGAYQKGDEMLYSLGATPHEEFLQYLVDEKTLEKFAPESILAHALWELTAYSFEEKFD